MSQALHAPEIAVVMACDAGYAPYAFCLAAQIAQAHPDRSFDICIFSQLPLTLPDTLARHQIKLIQIQGDNPFSRGQTLSRHGAETYLRLILPSQIAGRYRRILYLDSDILLNGAGLDQLLDIDLKGHVLAAVRDNMQWRTPARRVTEAAKLGRPAMPYFNAGVLLVDVDAYNRADILQKCLALFASHPAALVRHDQSLLNLTLAGQWAELSPVWNWQYTWSSRFFADLAEPKLVHFIGSRKPWRDKDAALPARYRRAYVQFMAAHYPDQPELAPVSADKIGWPPDLARSLLKHWTSASRMQRYLHRFSDDFSVQSPQ